MYNMSAAIPRFGVKLVKDVQGTGVSKLSSSSKPKSTSNTKKEPEKKKQKVNAKARALLDQLGQEKEETASGTQDE